MKNKLKSLGLAGLVLGAAIAPQKARAEVLCDMPPTEIVDNGDYVTYNWSVNISSNSEPISLVKLKNVDLIERGYTNLRTDKGWDVDVVDYQGPEKATIFFECNSENCGMPGETIVLSADIDKELYNGAQTNMFAMIDGIQGGGSAMGWGNVQIAATKRDRDFDGYRDNEEYSWGSDLNDSNSCPRISLDGDQLSWERSRVGTTYNIRFKEKLSDEWQTVGSCQYPIKGYTISCDAQSGFYDVVAERNTNPE